MKLLFSKIFQSLLVMLGVIVLVFVMFQSLGDPAKLLIGQSGNQATIDNIKKELYLDQPGWKQLLFYINDVSPISIHDASTIKEKELKGFFIGGETKVGLKIPYLRKSYQTKKDTIAVIADALPGTLILTCCAMLFAIIFGISLGIIAALRKNSWIDNTAIVSSIAGISAPSFFMAIVIAYIFGIVLHDYTGLSVTGSLYQVNELTGEKTLALKNLILPAITLGIRPMAIITQLTRSSMLDVLGQDYIRTAYAKGLSKHKIILRHALPNSLNPVITAVTGWFAELLAGAFFVEYIFGWKGLGKITVDALEKLDYPIVMGSVLVSAFIFVLVNMFSDILYKKLDPRIK